MRKHALLLSIVGLLAFIALAAVLALAPDAVRAGPAEQAEGATAPRVLETDPLSGAELALDGVVTLYFDQPMDMEGVQALLAVQPDTPLTFEVVDEATLRVTAAQGWLRATRYTFMLPAEALSAAGEPLAEPFTLALETVGYLEVSEVLPASGAEQIQTDSVITVIFNRPVVPLVTAEDMDTLPDPLALDPAVEGEGEWLNTAIYVFRPERLEGGTTYTATVAAGLMDVTGGVLEEDFTWVFETLPPAVLSFTPGNMEGGAALDAPVTLTFNQAMAPESVEAAFVLVEQESGAVAGRFAWNDERTEMTFTPAEPLALDGFYTAQIDAAQARAANGSAQMDETLAWNFTTVGQPRIMRTEPGDGSRAEPSGGFSIYFATPMDEDSLADRVQIDPAPGREYDSYYYNYDNRLQVSFPLEPSTEYTVTILPGMADVYGNTIDTEQVVRFTTQPYAPSVTLNTPGRVGLYSAYNPETRLFATHLNVDQLDLELYGLSLQDLARMNGPDGWEQERIVALRQETLLRRWSIPLESELNQRWYELLAITALGESTPLSCPGAPEPRLEVGGMATVITDPDPLRAREGSPSGEIVDLLYKDYQMPVTGGPVCDNGFIWWQVALRDGSLAWVAEGDSSEYYLELTTPAPEIERPGVPPVQTAAVGGEAALPPGAYYLRVTAPETQARGHDPLNHMMVVATANVTFKFSSDSALAWVTDLETGEPVTGVPVEFYDRDFTRVASSVTDADGLAQATIPALEDLYQYLYAVVNTPDTFGFAVSDWGWGVEPYDFNQMADYFPVDMRGNLYTDRPIYRPGQPVYFRGVLRARDDVIYTPPPMDVLPIRVEDNRGETVYEATLPLTEFGTFSGEFTLAEDAGLGYYQIVAEVEEAEYYSPRNFSVSFGVAEYRAPEFQVTVTPEVPAVVQGEDISVLVEGRYFSGGVVSNAEVTYAVMTQNYFFSYSGLERYAFTDYNYDEGPGAYYGMGGYDSVIAEGSGMTDAQGRFLLELPADLGEKTQSQTYTIEISITDESDQSVFNRETVIVHQGEVYVGVQPEEYVGLAGEPNAINLISVGWDSAPVAGQVIDYEVVERRWSSVQEEDEFGRTVWTWEVEELPVEGASGSVTTAEDGTAVFEFVPPVAGTYKVYATTRDARGNLVRSSAFVWVSGQQYVSWRQQNSNRIDLITDRDSYKVGDMAEVLIASPWQGEATALVTIERGDILHHEVIALETNSTVYRFPIEDAYAPNVYVSVLLVKGVDENTPTAEFRMGMAGIAVDPERREITVTVRPDREQAGPRETVTYTVETTDYAGNPVQAEVGVGLTDLAVLTLAEPNSQPLMQTFYGQQGLGVRTAVPLTLSVDQLTQTTLDTVKGGGGGGGEGGIFEVRQEFVDTPYWNPAVVTDENGQATFEVTLPDNLTTWRLDARAVTAGRDGITLVGQAEADLLSTKPLLLRPVTPRFFVVDDVVTLAAVVNNNTDTAQDVEASLQAAGVAFNSPQDLSAEIPAGGRQRFEWVVTVENVENVDLTFYASGNEGAFTDASKPGLGQGDDRLLPVYRYEVPEVAGTGGMIAEPGTITEAISLPRSYEVTQGELSVRVDASLAATTLDGLDYLENFPHQCIEQTVSRFLPNVMTVRALESLGVADDDLRASLEREVSFGLQRLYAQQKSNGGWGWFVNDRANPLTTAYALIGLVEARASGFAVSEDVIQQAVAFLNDQLVVVNENTEAWQLNRQAFILYALARAERGNVARTMRLFEFRQELSIYAQAYLAVALNRMAVEMDTEIEAMVAALVSQADLSATGAHWEEDFTDWWNWNTDTRTTAITLGALIELDPGNPLLAQAVRWLMVSRQTDHWETTQETAWALMALTDWMVTTGELEPDYAIGVGLNGIPRMGAQATPQTIREAYTLRVAVADLLADEANLLTLTHGDGPGVMYYTAHLRAFLPVSEVEPLNRGIILNRRYSLADDPDRTPVEGAAVGQNVRVTLTIIAPTNLHYVVIEDPIPAGTDAVNPNLETQQQIGTQPEVDRTDPLSRGWGWWYFSNTEFRDEKVVIYAEYLPRGTYEYSYMIRPGLAGEYNVIPTTGYEFYFPEVYGRGAGTRFTIMPEEAGVTE